MGTAASIQTNVTNIQNQIKNEVNQQVTVNGNIKCTLTLGKIKFFKTNGCAAVFANNCYAKSEALLETVQKIMIDFYNNLNVDQKQEAAKWFTMTYGVATTTSNIENVFVNTTNQICEAYSNALLEQTINEIEIVDCTAPPGQTLMFDFVNAGSATAQCASKIVTDLAVTASNDISVRQSQGMDWSKIIWPIVIAIVIIAIVYIILNVTNKTILSPEDKKEMQTLKNNDYVSRISSLINLKTKV